MLIWSVHMIVRNVLGHCGHELMPRWMIRSGWFDWLTTTTHHDLHHQFGRCNYGLYFTWWDRWMGTEHPEYRARLASAAGLTGWVAVHRTEAQRG
jgi:sterol desaturase/sphingolipid hydroxylase (fatty acid hydroxylase superfamily)